MFLTHFILSRLLWFGSLFCRLEASGYTLLWNLSFMGGMDPVTCQGLMLCGICVCAVPGRSVSLLSEVQWIVHGLCFEVLVGLLWLHATPLIIFTVAFLFCWRIAVGSLVLNAGSSAEMAFHVDMETLGCVCRLMSWGREFNVDLKFWNRCLDLWVSVPRLQ